jgi:hypothetical protein
MACVPAPRLPRSRPARTILQQRSAAAAERDTSEATRLFIQSGVAARVEAERKAAALLQEAGALERVQIELLKSGDAVDLFVSKHQRLEAAAADERRLAETTAQAAVQQRALAASAAILRSEIDPMYAAQQRFDAELTRADDLFRAGAISIREYDQAQKLARDTLYVHAQAVTGNLQPMRDLDAQQSLGAKGAGAHRAALQGLSFQLQDTLTQISMNANILQVLAIQGGQAAGQFANLEGKAGAFGRFMIGPYGLAITAAMLVLGPFVGKMIEGNSALDDAVDKLKKDAAETELAARAKARFQGSVEGLTIALREQDAALKQTAASERSSAERANIAAQAKRNQALATRQATAAALAEALAQVDDFSLTGGTTGAAALQNQARSDRVADLKRKLAAAEANATAAERQLNVSRVDLAAEPSRSSMTTRSRR